MPGNNNALTFIKNSVMSLHLTLCCVNWVSIPFTIQLMKIQKVVKID